MSFLLPDTDLLQAIQEDTMVETCTIVRGGVQLYADVKCRVTSARLFSEPADPYDANIRSMAEWGFTMPIGTDVQVGDTVLMDDRESWMLPISVIIGEVVVGDTWESAVRSWGNAPKTAVKKVNIVIVRELVNETEQILAAQTVQIVYDRVRPEETPVRYQELGRASYQGGTVIGGSSFNVMVSDRFTLSDDVDPSIKYACYITEVLPLQQQRREAKFLMDVGGVR